MMASTHSTAVTHTTHKVVLPFYTYAAVAFLVSTLLLFQPQKAFTGHYFNPGLLALAHIMALGWGTMIILGASHQLLPVIANRPLASLRLANASFICAAIGIPLLAYGFYSFNMAWPAKWGGRFVLIAIGCYAVNVIRTSRMDSRGNPHLAFIATAALWLFITAFLGLALVYNFTFPFLHHPSLYYLPLHAHTGIIGWFLLMVIGVGSRLIPMFLVSKYTNNHLLWIIWALVNGSLIVFLFFYLMQVPVVFSYVPAAGVMTALILFAWYCRQCLKHRIRRQVDQPMKISLSSVGLMLLPFVLLVVIIAWLLGHSSPVKLVTLYGFVIFFGWITALILGMTFKTLPFIVWNRIYHARAGEKSTPNPKDLVHDRSVAGMIILYAAGFLVFIGGIYLENGIILKAAAVLLTSAAVIYNFNVLRILRHKPAIA